MNRNSITKNRIDDLYDKGQYDAVVCAVSSAMCDIAENDDEKDMLKKAVESALQNAGHEIIYHLACVPEDMTLDDLIKRATRSAADSVMRFLTLMSVMDSRNSDKDLI